MYIIPELQYWSNEIVKNCSSKKENIPYGPHIEINSLNTEKSIVNLLFNENWDSNNIFYYYLYGPVSIDDFSKSLIRRISVNRHTNTLLLVTGDNTNGMNVFNLTGTDFVLLDALLYYRVNNNLIIQNAIGLNFDSNTGTLSTNYNDIDSNLSKLIYVYLKAKVDNQYVNEYLNNNNIISTNLLEHLFEFFVNCIVFELISIQNYIVPSTIYSDLITGPITKLHKCPLSTECTNWDKVTTYVEDLTEGLSGSPCSTTNNITQIDRWLIETNNSNITLANHLGDLSFTTNNNVSGNGFIILDFSDFLNEDLVFNSQGWNIEIPINLQNINPPSTYPNNFNYQDISYLCFGILQLDEFPPDISTQINNSDVFIFINGIGIPDVNSNKVYWVQAYKYIQSYTGTISNLFATFSSLNDFGNNIYFYEDDSINFQLQNEIIISSVSLIDVIDSNGYSTIKNVCGSTILKSRFYPNVQVTSKLEVADTIPFIMALCGGNDQNYNCCISLSSITIENYKCIEEI